MKFLRFASLLGIVTILAFGGRLTHAADAEDLPLPDSGFEQETPSFDPLPQEELPEIPAPSLGEDIPLPEPGAGSDGSQPQNQVNVTEDEKDEVFLPTPDVPESRSQAPLGTPMGSELPMSGGLSSRLEERQDWGSAMSRRPIVSLHGGMGVFNYVADTVQANRMGPTLGASVRMFNIAQTVFLHLYGGLSWVNIGDAGPYPMVKDLVLQLGGLVEVGIGRRISLFGSLLRRSHTLSAGASTSSDAAHVSEFVLPTSGIKPGIGIQYDFYVIPHGSLGLRAHVEQDMALVVLTMALEPAPRKRLSLGDID